MTCTIHWCPRDENDKDKRKDKDKDKDKMTKRPNMCHIFENDMTQGYQLWWWRMNQWLITLVMHWCAGGLMRWWCWCTDAADALMLLMRWCCWCSDAADVLMLLIRCCCWCTDADDALMLLMCWCCWCTDAIDAADALILADLSIAFYSSWSPYTKYFAKI